MKVWITQYALTQGIYEVGGEKNGNLFVVSKTENTFASYFHKPYWHETKEEAIKHAEQLREKKLKSLEKQISKLKKLQF